MTNLKTLDELHIMTLEELRLYKTRVLNHFCEIKTVLDYRETTNDVYNPKLLECDYNVVGAEE